ncbi:MAG: AmmeMemoRadiSam system protein A [Candidatus Marinimicrobia bacterium]|jgi:AmmeMemoRadiSam system protein A|nr:AmmeMemoRadiSam system protein A [Candidatus Neomarinimicrobiota bacterium]
MNVSKEKKIKMLKAVRNHLEYKLLGKQKSYLLEDEFYDEKYGLFVTLHEKGDLRGCIGLIKGIKPLRSGIIEMAESAAFQDPRFSPVTKDELDDIEIEISILSPLKEIDDWQKIIPGEYGVVMSDNFHQAVFLPQVATEQDWDLDTMLRNLAMKARIDPESYKDDEIKYKIFTATIFSEKDEK